MDPSLSNLQLELLRIFSFDPNEAQLKEIKGLVLKYFAEKVDTGVEELFKKGDDGSETIEEWSREYMRLR